MTINTYGFSAKEAEQVLEAVRHAKDGLITRDEMVRKLHVIAGPFFYIDGNPVSPPALCA